MANEHSNTPTPEQAHIIPLSKIHEMPGVFNSKPVDSKLGSMVLSIQSSGIKEPVIVRDRGDGHYQLLCGYRRRRASELAKKEDIPAFVYEMTVQEAISYRRAVKDNPKATIPGKLVEPEAVKGKDAEKPAETAKADAEKSGEADHLPTVAELEAQAKAGKVVNISEIIAAQQREREAKKDAPATAKEQKRDTGKGTPKSTLRPTESEAEKMKKASLRKKPTPKLWKPPSRATPPPPSLRYWRIALILRPRNR